MQARLFLRRALGCGGSGPARRLSLRVAPPVAEALRSGGPVVALESTIITHGMPYPHNLETAQRVEDIVREQVICWQSDRDFCLCYVFSILNQNWEV